MVTKKAVSQKLIFFILMLITAMVVAVIVLSVMVPGLQKEGGIISNLFAERSRQPVASTSQEEAEIGGLTEDIGIIGSSEEPCTPCVPWSEGDQWCTDFWATNPYLNIDLYDTLNLCSGGCAIETACDDYCDAVVANFNSDSQAQTLFLTAATGRCASTGYGTTCHSEVAKIRPDREYWLVSCDDLLNWLNEYAEEETAWECEIVVGSHGNVREMCVPRAYGHYLTEAACLANCRGYVGDDPLPPDDDYPYP